MRTTLAATLITLLATLAAFTGGQAQAGQVDEFESTGVVHRLLLDRTEVVISGLRYRVSADARVEIRGSFGAFGLLRADMKVHFRYRRYQSGRLEIFEIEQLPHNSWIEET